MIVVSHNTDVTSSLNFALHVTGGFHWVITDDNLQVLSLMSTTYSDIHVTSGNIENIKNGINIVHKNVHI